MDIRRCFAEVAAPDNAAIGQFNPFLCEQKIDGTVGLRVIPSIGEVADFNSDDKFSSKTWVDGSMRVRHPMSSWATRTFLH